MGKKKPSKQPPVPTSSEAIPKISLWDRFWRWVFNHLRIILYAILYFAMLVAIWAYVICNWEKCISMQFFSQFDGNNILFLTGLALVILPFYKLKIEVKDLKVEAEMQREFQNADLCYEIHRPKGLSPDIEKRKEDN